jgi:cell wall-associated NlpC family hydrolase
MKRALKGASAMLALVSLSIACSSAPEEEERASSSEELSIAGTTLTANQAKWLGAIEAALAKVPGTPQERARRAAIVAWWSLKEGVLGMNNPYLHNLCTRGGGDVQIGHTEQCWSTWQVGISGIQVPNVTDTQVMNMAAQIYPGVSTTDILTKIATAAGISPSTITGTTGRVRSGWLLRDPAIGIALQWQFADDCVSSGPGWCYGFWPEAQAFASSLSRIQGVVNALEQRFLAAKPDAGGGTPLPGGTDLCVNANLGDGLYCATYFGAANDPKVLLDCRGKKTATKTTCPGSCERMPDGQNDRCGAATTGGSTGGSTGGALSAERAAMIDRAQQWVNVKMPYCGGVPGGTDWICGGTCIGRTQRADWDVYRSDCSGFVSWVWQLKYENGHRTWGFAPFNQEGAAFSQTISPNDLQPGDALNSATADRASQHIILFTGWADKANSMIKTMEEANCSDDLVVNTNRKMAVQGDGSVWVGGKQYWPIRKTGVQ